MSRMEVKVLGIPVSQDYEKNERGTRKGGYVEQMLSFGALCASFAQQAEIYQHYRLENVYTAAGLALMLVVEAHKPLVAIMDTLGIQFGEREESLLIDDMQEQADWFLVHGGIDLDPRAED